MKSGSIANRNLDTTNAWRFRCALFLVMTAMFFLADPARAADQYPPGKMTFQGFLTDATAGGAPLGQAAPANYTIVFKIYDQATGTDPINVLWAEEQVVTVDKGHFSVLLGEGGPVNGFETKHRNSLAGIFVGSTASDRFLGITVQGQSEINPRIQFFAAPYAQTARSAHSLVSAAGSTLLSADAGGSVAVPGVLSAGAATFNQVFLNGPVQSTGGNARGSGAVDVQTSRNAADQVASGTASVIGGGNANKAAGQNAVVSGGAENSANGAFSTVPGGNQNVAAGAYSLAAGRRAKANHDGSFVFADSSNADLVTTGNNQFQVRASGGTFFSGGTVTAPAFSGYGITPIGGIIMWSGDPNAVPDGWALCDGRVVNGRTTPDLRGRFILGTGQGGGLSNRPMNQRAGAETHTLTAAEMPNHNHGISNMSISGFPDGSADCCAGYWVEASHYGRGNSGKTTDTAGGNQPHNNMPPYHVLAFIMRVN